MTHACLCVVHASMLMSSKRRKTKNDLMGRHTGRAGGGGGGGDNSPPTFQGGGA